MSGNVSSLIIIIQQQLFRENTQKTARLITNTHSQSLKPEAELVKLNS